MHTIALCKPRDWVGAGQRVRDAALMSLIGQTMFDIPMTCKWGDRGLEAKRCPWLFPLPVFAIRGRGPGSAAVLVAMPTKRASHGAELGCGQSNGSPRIQSNQSNQGPFTPTRTPVGLRTGTTWPNVRAASDETEMSRRSEGLNQECLGRRLT